MPVKRRAPKGRHVNVSPEAVEIFKRATAILDAGDEEQWEQDGGRRREYLDASGALHRMLGLKPWECNVLDAEAQPPVWDNLNTQSWEKARELRLALEKGVSS